VNDTDRALPVSSSVSDREGTVTAVSWTEMLQFWRDPDSGLEWDCIFSIPVWLKAWWESFGGARAPSLFAVRHGKRLTGVAPLMIEGQTAHLMGSNDVCDYRDFIVVPGMEKKFLRTLLSFLAHNGVRRIDMGVVRADSPVLRALRTDSDALGCELTCTTAEPVYVMQLPRTWDDYLALLSRKERHEIRRKIRNLDKAGNIAFRNVTERDEVRAAMDVFIDLFRMNKTEKALFMNDTMARFFRKMADAMSAEGLLRLCLIDINGVTAAAAMCLDYDSTVFLYNNGYDQHHRNLSVGLLSKVFSIRDSIARHRKEFDFLKGAEEYKQRLAGRPFHLNECMVTIKFK
jgi:CelD/BcsL family acetyltransferase involved in cellulose biosynthesis